MNAAWIDSSVAAGLLLAAASAMAAADAPVQRIGALEAARLTLEQGGTFQARVADLMLQWRYLLDVARGEFRPKAAITFASQRVATSATATAPNSTISNRGGLAVNWKMPSGVTLTAQLDGDRQRQSALGYTGGRGVTIALALPLLSSFCASCSGLPTSARTVSAAYATGARPARGAAAVKPMAAITRPR